MTEEFVDIEGYEGLYQVSNLGRVKSLVRHHGTDERILKCAPCAGGYRFVGLMRNGKKTSTLMHRLVAKAFVPAVEDKDVVNHIDGIKHNNDASNLEWCTQKENIKHAWRTGLTSMPENGFHQGKPVINTETGESYKNALEAAKAIGIDHSTLCRQLRGSSKNKTKLQYVTSN